MRIHVGRPTGRRLAWIALALAVGLTLTAAGALATPGNGHGKGLGKGDTALVAAAKAQGKSTVPLLIATKPGATAAVASKLAGFGATVTDQSDRFGYLVVDVPTDKAIQAAKTVGILAANVDKALPAVVPTLEKAKDGGGTPPPANLGPQNAYMPTYRIGAPQFVAAHPTYDGRGAKVGIVDTGVDLDRPELQTALDLAGGTVPKIYDWTTKTQPRLSDPANGDPTWLPLTAATVNDNGQNLDTQRRQIPAAGRAEGHDARPEVRRLRRGRSAPRRRARQRRQP